MRPFLAEDLTSCSVAKLPEGYMVYLCGKTAKFFKIKNGRVTKKSVDKSTLPPIVHLLEESDIKDNGIKLPRRRSTCRYGIKYFN
jgi:hypothetical protein